MTRPEPLIRPSRPAVQRCADRISCACADHDGHEVPADVQDALREPGSPLPAGMQVDLSARLGHDLGKVRVHDGERATATARKLGAQAFTRGGDVVLDRRQLPAGRERETVLVHELVHAAQQQGEVGGRVDPARTPAEDQADRIADDVIARRPAPLGPVADRGEPPPPRPVPPLAATWGLDLTPRQDGGLAIAAVGPGLPTRAAGAVTVERRPEGFVLRVPARAPVALQHLPKPLARMLAAAAAGGDRTAELEPLAATELLAESDQLAKALTPAAPADRGELPSTLSGAEPPARPTSVGKEEL